MENRYGDKLEKANQAILGLIPAHYTLRFIMALELKRLFKKGNRVLDLGCGEGDSAKPLLLHTKANLDLLDVSEEMIRRCKKNLARFKKRTHYICEDGYKYLKRSEKYDFILSSWTMHNFKVLERKKLVSQIYKKLKKGGYFMLLDKIYPEKNKNKLLETQLRRYRYLSPEEYKLISDHEKKDHAKLFRIDNYTLFSDLKKIGFSKVNEIDRVERDALVITKK